MKTIFSLFALSLSSMTMVAQNTSANDWENPAIIAVSACVGETKKGSDTDSTATDVVEEDKGSQFTLEHFT